MKSHIFDTQALKFVENWNKSDPNITIRVCMRESKRSNPWPSDKSCYDRGRRSGMKTGRRRKGVFARLLYWVSTRPTDPPARCEMPLGTLSFYGNQKDITVFEHACNISVINRSNLHDKENLEISRPSLSFLQGLKWKKEEIRELFFNAKIKR